MEICFLPAIWEWFEEMRLRSLSRRPRRRIRILIAEVEAAWCPEHALQADTGEERI